MILEIQNVKEEKRMREIEENKNTTVIDGPRMVLGSYPTCLHASEPSALSSWTQRLNE